MCNFYELSKILYLFFVDFCNDFILEYYMVLSLETVVEE